LRDDGLRDEWARARAERAVFRADLARTMTTLDARARDPFGLKEKVRRHPVLAAGIAAGAGAILVNLLVRGGADDDRRDAGEGGSPSRNGDSPALDALRDVAVRVATPWITSWIAEHLGEPARPGEGATSRESRS
jgi:hypothetical protein